jgi:hypothetical protein
MMGIVKTDSAKNTWVAKNQRGSASAQNKMIMGAGLVIGGFCREFAGHAQVDPQPSILTKAKEHLFSVSLGRQQDLAWN